MVEGTFARTGGGGGEEEGTSPPTGVELERWLRLGGGEAGEWLGLVAGLAGQLPLMLLSALACALASEAARLSWHRRPPFHSCTITCSRREIRIYKGGSISGS